MKIKEIRDLNVEELNRKGKEMAEEMFRLHIRKTTDQLESPATLKRVRRDIARIKTVLREREGHT
jgi:large subunit ribosomal protein L29